MGDAGGEPGDGCPQRVRDALRWALRLLVAHGADSPRLDAELLLAHTLGVERPQLMVLWDDCLSPEQATAYTALVRRARDDEPIAYILGERAFYDVDLRVSPAVLIPRHETEHLVEEALAWAGANPDPLRATRLRVVDVGTGSGALAVVLARHLPAAEVWAVDVSCDALRVARGNAEQYGVAGRIAFLCADLLDGLAGPFQVIVANLPYIDPLEWPDLQPGIRRYEPRLALDGGERGMAVIERLIAQLPDRLGAPGIALLECDHRQARELATRAGAALPDAGVRVLPDLAGLDRVVRIERTGAGA
jgi:release factor glutamine methyltransferase